jgi:hypothetical protein
MNRRSPRTLVSSIALLCVISTAAPARADNPQLKQGITLLRRAENAQAVRVLRRALAVPDTTKSELASIHLYLGIAHFNLLQNKLVRTHLLKAMTLDSRIRLPANLPPRLQELFDELRRQALPPDEPAPPPPVPERPMAVATAPPPRPASGPALAPADLPPPRPPTNWPAWVAAGVGAAAAVAGIVLAGLTVAENNQVDDKSLTSRAADEHSDAASARALGANICFGIAGAAAVTSGVLFYLGWRKAHGRSAGAPTAGASAVLVPLDSGAVLQIGNIRW